jgi:alpha-N-arabinofuranosidase
VVNRHRDKAITADILNTAGSFEGKAEASIVNSKDLQQPFSFDKKEQYIPVKQEVNAKNNQLGFSFPPHSFTQLKIILKRK